MLFQVLDAGGFFGKQCFENLKYILRFAMFCHDHVSFVASVAMLVIIQIMFANYIGCLHLELLDDFGGLFGSLGA
jgi:hypothetical protein